MSSLGNLLIVSQNHVRAVQVASAFDRARYQTRCVPSGAEALAAIQADPPDVILAGDNLTDMSIRDFLSALANLPEARGIPVAADTADPALWYAAQGGKPAIDDLLTEDFSTEAIIFRLLPLFRLSTMQSELDWRRRCCFGGSDRGMPDFNEEPRTPAHGIYIGMNPNAGLPEGFLGGQVIWETATSLDEAESLITGPGFRNVTVIDSDMNGLEAVALFCRDMRDNPRLFNLPFLVRVPMPSASAVRDLYRSGVNRVIDTAAAAEALAFEVGTLIRLQTRRNWVRDALQLTLDEGNGFPRQGVYGEAFLKSYLEARLTWANAHKRALSVVHLHLPEAESLLRESGEAACFSLAEQIARWLARLVRVEDMTARLSDSDFVVVLPDTLQSEAMFVMHRIAGVLTFTDFAVPFVYRPVKVWPLIGIAGREADDTPAAILERARQALA